MTHGLEKTPGLKGVLALAKQEAKRLGHGTVGPEHYLLGILEKGQGIAIWLLGDLGVRPVELLRMLEEALARRAHETEGTASAAAAQNVLDAAEEIAREMGFGWVGSEHLLLALVRDKTCLPGRIFAKLGVAFAKARQEIQKLHGLRPTSQKHPEPRGSEVLDLRGLLEKHFPPREKKD